MSLFQTVDVPCPGCESDVSFDLVFSVNAGRAPELREQILAGTFQSQACSNCGKEFRIQPEFNYLDIARDLWIAAFPLNYRSDWKEHERHALEIFDRSFGSKAGAAAQEMGRNLRKRVVFGWGALNEKIIALEHDLDDVTLELAKVAIIRGLPDQPLADETELRLFAFEGDDFVMGWIESAFDRLIDQIQVPRSLYEEIAADPVGWEELRGELSGGLFVDAELLMIESK